VSLCFGGKNIFAAADCALMEKNICHKITKTPRYTKIKKRFLVIPKQLTRKGRILLEKAKK
jgi:hypothetical protein